MKKRILVVEDHELLLLATRDILEVEGYDVETARDGIDALEKMQSFTPNLIIADIGMPRMNGYRFFEEVRTHSEWVPIPFIFLTAMAEREDRLKGKAMGAEDYLIKPFDTQELVIVVKSRIGRAEALREASENEFDDLKQQIITLLSHELRTPLTSVYGYTELALEEATDLPAGDFQLFLQGIQKGADRLTHLVEDLLMVVRLDTGELQREFDILGAVNTSVGSIVQHAVDTNYSSAASQGVTIETHIPSMVAPVRIHPNFLMDALNRIIDNAIKFSRREEKRITVSVKNTENEVTIAIRDRGVGIQSNHLSRIFERFGQVDRGKMEQQGAGLGLVISKALIECMKGSIQVTSVYGEGSTFTIHLPVVNQAENRPDTLLDA
ncbi:MAG: HAMP domain-containing sensor histidine kinase [Anaerolineae bacterium]|nr:HAMP domain-containing sensor histidine kinase [Anaerolineae bacterium]